MNLFDYTSFFTKVREFYEDPTPYIIAQGIKKEQQQEFINLCKNGVKPESASAYYDRHITNYLNDFINPINENAKNKYYMQEEKTHKPSEYRREAQNFYKKSKKVFTGLIVLSILVCVIGLIL